MHLQVNYWTFLQHKYGTQELCIVDKFWVNFLHSHILILLKLLHSCKIYIESLLQGQIFITIRE